MCSPSPVSKARSTWGLLLLGLAASSAGVYLAQRRQRDPGVPTAAAARRLRLRDYDVPATVLSKPSRASASSYDGSPVVAASEIAADIAQTWGEPAARRPDGDASFQWSDIDIDKTYPCGKVKCFFRSASAPAEGYLMWETGHEDQNKFHTHALGRHMIAYDFARRFERDYAVRQFLTGPPFEMTRIPEETRAALGNATETLRSPLLLAVAIQPSRSGPAQSKTFKCKDYMRNRQINGLDELLERSEDKPRLLKELAYTISLLDENRPLAFHFQILISDDGRVYHLDLDRWPLDTGDPAEYAKLEDKAVWNTKVCLEHAMREVTQSIAASEA